MPPPSGSYDQIDAEHRKILGIDGCGYHFVIGNGNGSGDGQIEVAQRWTNQKQGVHCRNARTHDVDEYGIGICLVGDLDKEPPTPRQIAAAKALIAHLSTRYNIAQARVQTHAHLAATKTVCPGRHFPNDEILALSRRIATNRPPGSSRLESRPRSEAELLSRQHRASSRATSRGYEAARRRTRITLRATLEPAHRLVQNRDHAQ